MNKFIKIFTYILALSTIAAGCKKDETLFKGVDNYIKSFKLKKDHLEFNASFTDTSIVVEVPDGLSLNNATAIVTLSENATIYPSPDSITNWNEEAQFVITAFNGLQKVYRYTMQHKAIELKGSVLLQTQAEVDAFGEKNITAINGNLIIGRQSGMDSIISLTPLNRLKTISHVLTIYPTYKGKDLTGLDNIEKIGALKIDNLNAIEKVDLPSLKEAGSVYIKSTAEIFVYFESLETVKQSIDLLAPLAEVALPVLKSIKGNLQLYSGTNNPTLIQKLSLPELVEVGDLIFTLFNNATKLELPKLENVNNINLLGLQKLNFVTVPKLHTITGVFNLPGAIPLSELSFPSLVKAGGFNIQTSSLSSFEAPLLEEITENIYVGGIKTDGIKSLRKLHTVHGELTFDDLPAMNGIGIPETLKKINTLTIRNRSVPPASIINIKGLDIKVLKIIVNQPVTLEGEDVFKGTLVVDPAAQINFPTLIGFREVDSIGFNGYVSYMNNVEIKGIQKINGSFWMPNNNIQHFSLPDLEEVAGNFVINHLNSVTTPEIVIPRLRKVGGNMDVKIQSTEVITLSFPLLKEVLGSLTLGTGYSTRSLTNLHFPELELVNGDFAIISEFAPGNLNNKLLNLDGFNALKKVNSITIANQTSLNSYGGLQNLIPHISDEQWTVINNSYNPTLTDLQNGAWINP